MTYIRNPLFWLGLAISGASLFFAFRGLNWTEVGDAIIEADYALLALALPVMVMSLYLRAFRWAVLFHPQKGMRLGNLMGAMNIGHAFNNIMNSDSHYLHEN